jgi:histidyl-tRNA synthetase
MDKPQTLKGFRDFLPAQMIVREKVIGILKNVFENFGFEPLATPTLEYADVLMGKYGEEADKLLYLFEDRGGRKIGLNYDLTVPTARVLAQYADLPKPFKRYQIQSSYRAENTQKGRYRQFTQCDIDTIGSQSPASDAEILTITSIALEKLKFANFKICLNSRTILYRLMESAGIVRDKWNTVLQTVDKMMKVENYSVLDDELKSKGIGETVFTKFINPKIREISNGWSNSKSTGDPYLDEVFATAIKMGANNVEFSPTIVRGLDYYTGPIFETFVTEPKIGSIAGGGRYDNLIKQLGGPDLPAVGTTLGLDRICDVIEELNLLTDTNKSVSRILVTVFSPDMADKSLFIAQKLRDSSINTDLYLDPNAKLEKQLKYADLKGIPYIIIQGPEEVSKNTVRLKNMTTKEQKELSVDDLIVLLK